MDDSESRQEEEYEESVMEIKDGEKRPLPKLNKNVSIGKILVDNGLFDPNDTSEETPVKRIPVKDGSSETQSTIVEEVIDKTNYKNIESGVPNNMYDESVKPVRSSGTKSKQTKKDRNPNDTLYLDKYENEDDTLNDVESHYKSNRDSDGPAQVPDVAQKRNKQESDTIKFRNPARTFMRDQATSTGDLDKKVSRKRDSPEELKKKGHLSKDRYERETVLKRDKAGGWNKEEDKKTSEKVKQSGRREDKKPNKGTSSGSEEYNSNRKKNEKKDKKYLYASTSDAEEGNSYDNYSKRAEKKSKTEKGNKRYLETSASDSSEEDSNGERGKNNGSKGKKDKRNKQDASESEEDSNDNYRKRAGKKTNKKHQDDSASDYEEASDEEYRKKGSKRYLIVPVSESEEEDSNDEYKNKKRNAKDSKQTKGHQRSVEESTNSERDNKHRGNKNASKDESLSGTRKHNDKKPMGKDKSNKSKRQEEGEKKIRRLPSLNNFKERTRNGDPDRWRELSNEMLNGVPYEEENEDAISKEDINDRPSSNDKKGLLREKIIIIREYGRNNESGTTRDSDATEGGGDSKESATSQDNHVHSRTMRICGSCTEEIFRLQMAN